MELLEHIFAEGNEYLFTNIWDSDKKKKKKKTFETGTDSLDNNSSLYTICYFGKTGRKIQWNIFWSIQYNLKDRFIWVNTILGMFYAACFILTSTRKYFFFFDGREELMRLEYFEYLSWE